jgi:catechol 2,3-dioxygenase-like lactoylglutathione lyase family enzyme
MALHQLASVTIGVPDVEPVASYYEEFGLHPTDGRSFSTVDGGDQLFLTKEPRRRLTELVVGVDHVDDLARVQRAVTDAGHRPELDERGLSVVEPLTGIRLTLRVAPRLIQAPRPVEVMNRPGQPERSGERSSALTRSDGVRPRRLGHAVVTSPDYAATSTFFTDLIGFRVSDYIVGAGVFLRCSTDHHNLLVLGAQVVYLHHTAWQVDDVDDVGRGAAAMLEGHPDRHVWGLGRHHAGSNFFWYLRDPAGNYSEYFADLDFIPEDAEWVPSRLGGNLGLYQWGPPVPSSFLQPTDVTEWLTTEDRSLPSPPQERT